MWKQRGFRHCYCAFQCQIGRSPLDSRTNTSCLLWEVPLREVLALLRQHPNLYRMVSQQALPNYYFGALPCCAVLLSPFRWGSQAVLSDTTRASILFGSLAISSVHHLQLPAGQNTESSLQMRLESLIKAIDAGLTSCFCFCPSGSRSYRPRLSADYLAINPASTFLAGEEGGLTSSERGGARDTSSFKVVPAFSKSLHP